MKIEIFAKTDPGNLRDSNEDYFGVDEQRRVVVVCDGMGGHQAGGYASKLAVATFQKMFNTLDEKTAELLVNQSSKAKLPRASRLLAAIRLTNSQLFNESKDNPQLRGMGTTLTALEFCSGLAMIGHVGDSRIYRFRGRNMEQLTRDHTWLNELIEDKEILPQEARKFGKSNVITRALGLEPAVKIDVRIEPLVSGDLFLICTDGLSKALNDDEIKRIVVYNRKNFQHTIQHLLDDANIKDGSDNMTVVLVYVAKAEKSDTAPLPINLTLKPESREIIGLEKRILKNKQLNFALQSRWWQSFKNIFKRGKLQ